MATEKMLGQTGNFVTCGSILGCGGTGQNPKGGQCRRCAGKGMRRV